MAQEDGKSSTQVAQLENLVKTHLDEIASLKNTIAMLREELSQSGGEYFEQILNILPFPGNLYWKTIDGVYLGCNKNMAKLAGLSSYKEIVGKTDKDLSWKNRVEDLAKNDQLVIKTGCLQTFEETGLTSSGSRITVITNKMPIKNKNDEIVGIIGTSIDITKQKEQEIQLEESLKQANIASHAKSEFIANMSHDIRTPITGLIGMIQDLLYTTEQLRQNLQADTSASVEKQTERLQDLMQHTERNNQVMLSSVDELLRLCNEILEVTRLESGISKPSVTAFSLHELVEHNIKLLKPVANHQQLQLKIEIDKNIPPYLCGLYSYLDRTLLNLMSNALKFTKDGSVCLFIKLVSPANKCRKGDVIKLAIQVKDTGIGIPSDKFDVIFEHFSRLTPSYEGIYQGSGLGLYTVKKYVEAMQGEIAVESEVGHGTCFTLTLPFVVDNHADASAKNQSSFFIDRLSEPTITPEASSKASSDEVNDEAGIRILVVEDNKAAGIMVSMSLKRLHCQVDIAATGLEGIEKAQQKSYDLILMDVGLPDIDGLEVTRRIRALPADQYKQLPIVALTGHVTEDKYGNCIASGMNDVITKPAPPLMLESLLKRFVWKLDQDKGVVEAIPNQSAQKKDVLPVIDWEGCVIAVGDDPDVAKQLLAICSDELKATKQVLEEGYQEKDLIKLRAELHKCLGGVVYLRLPRLEAGLRAFQAVTHDEPDNTKKFSGAYHELQNAIQAYHDEWQELKKNN